MKATVLTGLALSVLTLGCIDSTAPLSDPGSSTPDERLAGLWCFHHDQGQTTYYHIGHVDAQLPEAVMVAVGVTHRDDKVSAPQSLLLFPTTLAGKTFLNVIGGDANQIARLEKEGWRAAKGYILLHYRIEGDHLVLRAMDRDAKKRAIESGKIKGVVEKNRPARFTDTTKNLAQFVAEAGDGLFSDDTIRLERVTIAKNR